LSRPASRLWLASAACSPSLWARVRGRDTGAHALLRSAVPFRLDAQVGDGIVAEKRGNPLALLVLP
jgi:hypothetical protein